MLVKGYPITSLSSCKYRQTEGQTWEIEPKTGLDYDYLAKLNKTWVITQQ